MVGSLAVTELKSEDYVFPATVKAPGSDKHLFLGGAGVRGLEIEGKFVKFTTMAMYLEESAITALSPKWKGKTADELAASEDFFQDIVTGPFERFLQVTCLVTMPGAIYSSKVSEQCVETWKSEGIYTDEVATANQKFLEAFKDQMFPPGYSVLFTLSPYGSAPLTIAFSKHDSIPETGVAVIENKNLVEGITNAAIGKGGVSPEAKKSLADRISQLLNNTN